MRVVIYLLDINVLLAMGFDDHPLHQRAHAWVDDLQASDPPPCFATCSITELGFVRIAAGSAKLAQDVTAARFALDKLKAKWPFIFLSDPFGADRLPEWVQRDKHVTDGHLLQLATAHRMPFATLDARIPGALLIPEHPDDDSWSVREPPVYYGVAA